MPWTTLLTALQRHLFSCLRKLLEEQGRDWFVGYEQKMRLDPHDQRVGVLPDLYVLPCQPEDPNFAEWPAYVPGIPVPVFALEVVSRSNWEKDYVEAPQKYAKLGVEELLLFDALALEGESPASDPYVLQLYRRGQTGELRCVYTGEGPVFSEELRGWFRTEEKRLTITRDQAGKSVLFRYEETERWWGKLEEAREAKDLARQQAEKERAAKEEAESKAQREAEARQAAEQARKVSEQGKKDAESKLLHEAEARQAAEQGKKEAESKLFHEAQARIAAEQAMKDAESRARNEAQARLAAEQAKKDAEQQAQSEARQAIVDLCEVLDLEWTEARRQQVDSLDLPALRQLRAALKQLKRWPA